MNEIVELRVDGHSIICHIELNDSTHLAYIPAWAHPWDVDMLFEYTDDISLVNHLLQMYGGTHHMATDYVGLMRRNLSMRYFYRVPRPSHV